MRFYKYLSTQSTNISYLEDELKGFEISLIVKSRLDILALNGNRFGENVDKDVHYVTEMKLKTSITFWVFVQH